MGAGGTPVFCPLRFVPYQTNGEVVDNDAAMSGGGQWVLDPDTLKSMVNSKTKAIILNSPHNPTGRIFTRDEMEYVAEAL